MVQYILSSRCSTLNPKHSNPDPKTNMPEYNPKLHVWGRGWSLLDMQAGCGPARQLRGVYTYAGKNDQPVRTYCRNDEYTKKTTAAKKLPGVN